MRDYRGLIYLPADSCFLVYKTQEKEFKKYSTNIFLKEFFFSQKSVRLISNTVVAVALYMLHMSHLSFLLTGVQIRISNSLFFFFLTKIFIQGGLKNMSTSHEFIIIRLFSCAFCLWH